MDVFSIYKQENGKMCFSEGQWKVFRKGQDGFVQISFLPPWKSFNLLLYLQVESVCSEFSSVAGYKASAAKQKMETSLSLNPETISICSVNSKQQLILSNRGVEVEDTAGLSQERKSVSLNMFIDM